MRREKRRKLTLPLFPFLLLSLKIFVSRSLSAASPLYVEKKTLKHRLFPCAFFSINCCDRGDDTGGGEEVAR